MSWSTTTIADICSLVTSGGTPTSTNESYYYPPEIPWLRTGEVNYCRIYDTEKHISQEGLANSSAKLIPANSVIIAMYGQGDTAGRVAINKVPITTNQACCNLVIDENKADYEFVYYALCTMYDKMVSLKNGGAQPNLNGKIIKSLEIPFPDLPTQHRIASILSAYDDLIENNRRQITLLEEAAQRLYREWFVELRFPGHEGVKVVDGVPEGWKQTTADEVTTILRRGISPSYAEDGQLAVISQKCIRQYMVDMSLSRKQVKPFDVAMGLQDADTVVCSTGTGTLGRVGKVFGDYPQCTFDSHVTIVRSNGIVGKHYLSLRMYELQGYFDSCKTGSTNQTELPRAIVQGVKVLVADEHTMNSFETLQEAYHRKMYVCQQQIERLTNARDMLLPKLMSGEMEDSHGKQN